jgi:hypothetical protein
LPDRESGAGHQRAISATRQLIATGERQTWHIAGPETVGGLEGVLGPEVDDDFPRSDRAEQEAKDALRALFSERRQEVFFSRQLEVMQERAWFHWVTKRALKALVAEGLVHSEQRRLAFGGTVNLFWHRSYRYYRRDAARVVDLINEYANPNMGAALGLQGELLVLEGLARHQMLLLDRETRVYRDREWSRTEHDLDFIFVRDGVGYGVEVKNTLGYMEQEELKIKVAMCAHLGLRPLFAVRMLPKTWINEIIESNGFALILGYQLYPWAHRDLAKTVRERFGLPVDAPRALSDGTTARFIRWHEATLAT